MSDAQTIGVMHVVDSLDIGGTETVAVNLANRLPRDRYRTYLCSTRRSGALAPSLAEDVGHLRLERRSRMDFTAAAKLRDFVSRENIRLIHVHATSLFFARLCTLLPFRKRVRVVWHDHYGLCEQNDRSAPLYRLATKGVAGVIAVNHRLADWARDQLHVPPQRVWYVPNFVNPSQGDDATSGELPGVAGSRIVCVANLRPQKDHLTLIRAMERVCRERPDAHLLVVGLPIDRQYESRLRAETASLGLDRNITFLGQVCGVGPVLRSCDVGVLSSASEGLPLSLLEYGWAGLPTVTTKVGQCAEVLDQGKAGFLVDPGSHEQLGDALLTFLNSPRLRAQKGRELREFVARTYHPEAILDRVCGIYDFVLNDGLVEAL